MGEDGAKEGCEGIRADEELCAQHMVAAGLRTIPRKAESSGTQIGCMLLCMKAENRGGTGKRVNSPVAVSTSVNGATSESSMLILF